MRASVAERLAHFAGIPCAAKEQCLGNPRHARSDLPQSMLGCIVQPPVVRVQPGPLVRGCLGVTLSSYSVSLGRCYPRCYPIDENSDDYAIVRTNSEIAAFSPDLNQRQVLRHRGRRWSILQTAPDHAHRWATGNWADDHCGTRLRWGATEVCGSFCRRPSVPVEQPVWLRALDETLRIE